MEELDLDEFDNVSASMKSSGQWASSPTNALSRHRLHTQSMDSSMGRRGLRLPVTPKNRRKESGLPPTPGSPSNAKNNNQANVSASNSEAMGMQNNN